MSNTGNVKSCPAPTTNQTEVSRCVINGSSTIYQKLCLFNATRITQFWSVLCTHSKHSSLLQFAKCCVVLEAKLPLPHSSRHMCSWFCRRTSGRNERTHDTSRKVRSGHTCRLYSFCGGFVNVPSEKCFILLEQDCAVLARSLHTLIWKNSSHLPLKNKRVLRPVEFESTASPISRSIYCTYLFKIIRTDCCPSIST